MKLKPSEPFLDCLGHVIDHWIEQHSVKLPEDAEWVLYSRISDLVRIEMKLAYGGKLNAEDRKLQREMLGKHFCERG